MKLKKILPVLLSVLFLTGAVFITSTAPKKSEKESLYDAIDVAVVWLERALASR